MSASAGVLHRVVYPLDRQDDAAVRSLYVSVDPLQVLAQERSSITLTPDATASWATYFGAIPLGWWSAYTTVSGVRLAFAASGAGIVRVRRSDAAGASVVLADMPFVAGRIAVDVPIGDAEGWAWFEITVGAHALTISDAAWFDASAQGITTDPTVTVCVTTHNREADCVALLDTLSSAQDELASVSKIVVVDQGDRPLAAAPGFDSVRVRHGSRLKVIRQPNLGGSGGFSRGMFEAAALGTDYALLLDDDVRLEPESLMRMLRFSARARQRVIVGAQMLNLAHPTRLHSFGERIDEGSFWWTPVDEDLADIDLARRSIEDLPGFHHVRPVDFNGWWMCLLPVDHIRASGGALPLFIKWDDVEYALRAKAAGLDTVTLPGVAVWHAAWTGKDDGLDWQAYFQLRNRVVTGLLHGARRGGLLWGSLAQDINHAVCQQYGSVAVRTAALREVVDGPSAIRQSVPWILARVRGILEGEMQTIVPAEDLPPAREAGGRVAQPSGAAAYVRRGLQVLARQVVPATGGPGVKVHLTRAEGKWWGVGMFSDATVASATGSGAFVTRRRPGHALLLLARAVTVRLRLWLTWGRMVRRYRSAAHDFSSQESWQSLFAERGVPDASGTAP
jgi:galactofuranosylgalactofuranosylrhamnosyl-N-acetylglucosaminyl-diphospho-decaprenol beta-1,5/1,6-galactofuranosyltransferase